MRLVFIHGPAASGKLTIARELAGLTGLPLFHNHLVVDALLSVFRFGSPAFVELREKMWIDIFAAAAAEGRSMIFTFHPEASVTPDFPERVAALVQAAGGRVDFVALSCAPMSSRRVSKRRRGRRAGNYRRSRCSTNSRRRARSTIRRCRPQRSKSIRGSPNPPRLRR